MGYDFVKTEDGSAGLFDNDVNDIYHSSSGAYKEALEKFVIPSQAERFKNKTCNVLDICYGIGYNTKALLNYSLKNRLNIEFKIDALEINSDLINLSPFIKSKEINFMVDNFILNSILQNFGQLNFDFNKIKKTINKNKNFLTIYKPNFDKIIQNSGYNYGVLEKINANLHNIYYRYKSIRHILDEKLTNFNKSSLKWHVNDARKSILSINDKYDIIFLDAFTASKQPLLWTKEFLSELIKRLNKDTGILVSYSSASPFRKVLCDNGLYVGKFYKKNILTTLASYSENLVKYKLDEFELGLLNTNAGIPYEDKELNLSGKEILNNRDFACKNSNLESTSNYYKRHNYGKYKKL